MECKWAGLSERQDACLIFNKLPLERFLLEAGFRVPFLCIQEQWRFQLPARTRIFLLH